MGGGSFSSHSCTTSVLGDCGASDEIKEPNSYLFSTLNITAFYDVDLDRERK